MNILLAMLFVKVLNYTLEFEIERQKEILPCILFLPSLVLLALLVVDKVGEGCLLPLLPLRGTAAATAAVPA